MCVCVCVCYKTCLFVDSSLCIYSIAFFMKTNRIHTHTHTHTHTHIYIYIYIYIHIFTKAL